MKNNDMTEFAKERAKLYGIKEKKKTFFLYVVLCRLFKGIWIVVNIIGNVLFQPINWIWWVFTGKYCPLGIKWFDYAAKIYVMA